MIDTETTQLQRALSLAALGLFVIPCHPRDFTLKSGKVIPAKSPRVLNGLYDATRDEDIIRQWWTSWPDSLIGVVAGPSELVFLDGDNKPGKDFDQSLFEAGITPPPTWTYETISGGKHYVYAAPKGVPLNGVTNYRGMKGVDRRGGASYAIWWGEVPAWPEWAPAPQWLCDPVQYSEGSKPYNGNITEWLDNHDGEPSPLLKHIQSQDFSEPGEGEYEHDLTLRLITRIVTLASQGEEGAKSTLEALKEKYLQGYEEYAGEWEKMVEWAIKNCGGGEELDFVQAQTLLPQTFDTTLLGTAAIPDLASALLEHITPNEALPILKRAKSYSGESDNELLQILTTTEPQGNTNSTPSYSRQEESPIILLDDLEREAAIRHWNQSFLGEYEDWILESIPVYNAPYHRAAAWSILATLLGDSAYFTRGKRKIPLNLWTWTLGASTTGKSEARDAMQTVIHGAHGERPNPDIGDDSSAVGLYENLRSRPYQATLFNSDEADGLIREMSQTGSWRTGQMSKWTYLYDGRVPPQLRRGETVGEWTSCVFNMYMSGTDKGVFDTITRSMFETGFLTRMCWFISENKEIPEQYLGMAEGHGDLELDDEKIDYWGRKFANYKNFWTAKTGSYGRRISRDEEETEEYFRRKTAQLQLGALSQHRNWDIIKPSVIRLSVSMYKMAALVAISDGRHSINKLDLQLALLQGEELVENLITVANGVSDSEHSKVLDQLERIIVAKPKGALSPDVYRQMSLKGFTKRDVDSHIEELRSQRRIRVEKGPDRGHIYIPLGVRE